MFSNVFRCLKTPSIRLAIFGCPTQAPLSQYESVLHIMSFISLCSANRSVCTSSVCSCLSEVLPVQIGLMKISSMQTACLMGQFAGGYVSMRSTLGGALRNARTSCWWNADDLAVRYISMAYMPSVGILDFGFTCYFRRDFQPLSKALFNDY